MRLLVDTNVLVYLAHTTCAENPKVKRFLGNGTARGTLFCFTWGIVYEFLRVVTHRRVLASPMNGSEALRFIGALLDRDDVSVLTATNRHWEVLQRTTQELSRPEGNLFHDVETAVLAREHGVGEIATADMDFLQFSFLKVVNPLV